MTFRTRVLYTLPNPDPYRTASAETRERHGPGRASPAPVTSFLAPMIVNEVTGRGDVIGPCECADGWRLRTGWSHAPGWSVHHRTQTVSSFPSYLASRSMLLPHN